MEATTNKSLLRSSGICINILGALLAVILCLHIMLRMLGVHGYGLIRYLMYLCVVISAPGIALLIWSTGLKTSLLRLICVGTGLGYCLEAFVFIGLSSLNLRGLWTLYPIIGIISFLSLLWNLHRTQSRTSTINLDEPAKLWLTTVCICAVLTVYMTYNAFLGSFYNGHSLIPIAPDLMLHLSTAAEIKHHWPLTDPRLTGFAFSYHYLAHIHIAAASLITGIQLQELLFRFYYAPLLVLVVLNTVLLTQVFTRSNSIQLLAVIMVFFSGTASLAAFSMNNFQAFFSGAILQSPGDPWVFSGDGYFGGSSPSLVYGLVLFLPLVLETIAMIDNGSNPRRRFLIIGLLMTGCMLAKGSFMPVFVTGLILSAIWLMLLGKNEWLDIVKIVVISFVICIPLYFYFLHQYWQGGAAPPIFSPFAIVMKTEIWSRFEPVLRSLWDSGSIKYTIDWTFRGIALLFSVIIIVIYFVISYGTRLMGIGFLFYQHGVKKMSSGMVLMISLILGALAPSYLLSLIDDNQMHFLNSAYPISGIIGALGLGHLILNTKLKPWRLTWQIFGILVLFISTWNSVYSLWSVYKIQDVPNILISSEKILKTSDVYAAQSWIQNNTSTNSVLAVSLYSEENQELRRRCDYSAFSERRLFLEGSHYQRGRNPNELAFRRTLLFNVFRNGDTTALKLLRERFQVTHLVVDNSDGKPVKLPDDSLTLLFQNSAVKIYSFENPSSS